jgi:uncharacterized protein (DUF2235 family)
MSKRIVVCCDGTWNTPNTDTSTNVVKMARAILPSAPDGTTQVVFYDWGVGTEKGLNRFFGGAFGKGLNKNVEDAYRFLLHNYEPEEEVFLFGFSRGAFTARSLVGLIRNCGLLHKDHADRVSEAMALYRSDDPVDSTIAGEFRQAYSSAIDIHCVGVWDTVGAMGIPLRGLHRLTRKRHQFHDVSLSKIVKHAYHALAIDEQRWPFRPSVWKPADTAGQVIDQAWFPGVHSDLGGGYNDHGLSDGAFAWILERAEACGLAVDKDYVTRTIRPDASATLHNTRTGFYRLMRPHVRTIAQGESAVETVAPPVIERKAKLGYGPDNLLDYFRRHPPTDDAEPGAPSE